VAYGEADARWLVRVGQRLLRHTTCHELCANHLLQFWLVGSDVDGLPDWVHQMPPDASPESMIARLDTGRGLENKVRYPSLQLQTLRIIERWSLFDPASARRLKFQEGLDAALRQNAQASGLQVIEASWISLADATRDAGEPSTVVLHQARNMLLEASVPEVILLIDRTDAGAAVVSRAVADSAYAALVEGLLTSEMGFPEVGQQPPLFLQQADDSCVLPFSVVVLKHGLDSLRRLTAHRLRRQLRHGSRQAELLESDDIRLALHDVLDEEVKLLGSDSLDFGRARARRHDAAAQFLYRALVNPKILDTSHREVQGVRARALQLLGARGEGHADGTRHRIASDERGFFRRLLDALLGRDAPGRPPKGGSESAGTGRAAHPLLEEWTALCDFLTRGIFEIDRWHRAEDVPLPVWMQYPGEPFALTLYGDPQQGDTPSPIDRLSLEAIARRLVADTSLLEPAQWDQWLDDAIDAAAVEVCDPQQLEDVLRIALRPDRHPMPAGLVRQMAPLIGPPATGQAETLWLSSPSLKLKDPLNQLELRGSPPARHIDSDDIETSIRLAVHQPCAWRAVQSLRALWSEA
jgi:hypothetical protein